MNGAVKDDYGVKVVGNEQTYQEQKAQLRSHERIRCWKLMMRLMLAIFISLSEVAMVFSLQENEISLVRLFFR